MDVLDIPHVYRVLASMTKPVGPYSKRVETLCKNLLKLGFHSIRYYEVVDDKFESENTQFVLAHAEYREPRTESVFGLKIPYTETTLVTSSNGSDGLARGHNDDSSDTQRSRWIHALDLLNTHWIDLEIKSRGELVGLLAVSWTGASTLIDKNGETALRIIRGTLGNLYTASLGSEDHFTSSHQKIINAASQFSEEPRKSISEISREIGLLLDCDVVSAFKYGLVSNRVEKVHEYINEDCGSPEVIDESYPLGQMITGKSFKDPDYRFIPDFDAFKVQSETHIDAASQKHYTENIGRITGIMYLILGSHSNRILLRLFRTDARDVPSFSNRDHEIAKLIEEATTGEMDGVEHGRRRSVIHKAAIDGLKGFSNPDDLNKLIQEELGYLGVTDYVSVHFSKLGNSTDFVDAKGRISDGRNFFGSSASEAWQNVRRIPSTKAVAELGLNRLQALGQTTLSSGVRSLGMDGVGLLCLHNQGITTALILPMKGVGGKNEHLFANRLSSDERTHLLSLLSIYGAALEAKASHISAENADDLLANIGHELQTPITEIEQSAISAVEACHEILDSLEPETQTPTDTSDVRRELEDETEMIVKKADLLRHFMDIPRTMSEFFGSEAMSVTFSQASWGEIVDESWALAYNWANEMSEYYSQLGRMSFGGVQLNTNEALKGMSCVMAEPLVKMAIVNLLKNAIKFSLPRFKGQLMVIDVHAIPQSGWNIIQVKNWGIGIEKNEFEEIFRKYHRIERIDAKRDIAGRGLGLYLARAMARAQGGDLFCESSEPKLDDPKKRAMLQGYLTTFELRLPTNNRPGTRLVSLK